MAYHSNGYTPPDDLGDEIDDISDKPTYLMEHLATFTVTKEAGIIYPADGMRRLLQLEKTNGIWSQKMQMCLDKNMVLIMDYETGSIMERFPGKSIQDPTAFTSLNPIEMYNNILVFNVLNRNPSHPPEMHIFQCQSIAAQDLVEDLKQVQMGKSLVSRTMKTTMPPQPRKQIQPVVGNFRGSDSELTAHNDDNDSNGSEQYERDVMVLNHCFDDIEKFIARLQHAAAAMRELERRRRTRKGKKSDMGDGMLSMRTRPPGEREFIDIFQKFKLSFGLLAKLKAHIHDPNAPELVHFLFTPLALIVEAAHDTYPEHQIPQKVVAPLLTREAINLLINCVTSKETELWHSLGNPWLVPREEWKGAVPTYHPLFMDNWSPDYPVIDDVDKKPFTDLDDYNDFDPSTPDLIYNDNEPKLHDMDPSTRSDISVDSIERNGADDRSFKRQQETWLDSLIKRNAHIVQVTYPRTANNDKELTVVRGEYLEVLDDSRKWWKARNAKNQEAHVPNTIVTMYQSDVYNNPVYVQRRPDSSFSDGHSQGPDHPSNTSAGQSERAKTPPPPPPPPVPVVVKPSTPALTRSPSVKSTRSTIGNSDDMQKELSLVLSEINKNKRDDIVYKHTPEVFINQKSSPEEVQTWLKDKQFSADTCRRLKGQSGHQILGLDKKQVEAICGQKEGSRLYGQLTIQKNVCGFQTVRSTELHKILARARLKIETKKEEDDEKF